MAKTMLEGGTDWKAKEVAARPVSEEALPEPAQRALTFGLFVSALRCTVQYVLLPFVLPWIGVAAVIPTWVTLALCGVALTSLVRNVRTLWRLRHGRRWNYLGFSSAVAAALLLFIVLDVSRLFGA